MRPIFLVLTLAAAALSASPAHAQDPLNRPADFVDPAQAPAAPGSALLQLASAHRAHDMGLPSAAADIFRALLALPPGAGIDRVEVGLELVTALMDADDLPEAEKALQAIPEAGRGAAWHLRAGLLLAHLKRFGEAREEIEAFNWRDLPVADIGWWHFLQGMLAGAAGNRPDQASQFADAQQVATPFQKLRFSLAEQLVYLRAGPVNERMLQTARASVEAARSSSAQLLSDAVIQYAIALNGAGQKAQAIEALRERWTALPPGDRATSDRISLILGFIGGAGEGEVGRNALFQLLATGADPDKQRLALQMLARASTQGAARTEFRRRLDDMLLPLAGEHPIRPDLLLMRAQLSVAEKTERGYQQAIGDASTLNDRYPASPLKAHALGLLAGVFWEQRRYGRAAEYGEMILKEAAGTPALQAQVGVLVAEAYFRAGNYRDAAKAYAAAASRPPAGMPRSTLIFQRVLAEIEAAGTDARQLGLMEPLMAELERDASIDPIARWMAEWNYARGLEKVGGSQGASTAYARINRLLEGGAPVSLPLELRVRMTWLQAQLALKSGSPDRALTLSGALKGMVEPLSPPLRQEILSSAELLKAQAQLGLGQEDAAMLGLEELRKGFSASDAAASSYLVQADFLELKGRTVDAENLLTKLAGEFPESPFAPAALYRAAVLEVARGQPDNLSNAFRRLDALVKDPRYARSEYLFYARLKQADLLSRLGDDAQAQVFYEKLLQDFSQHPGFLGVRLALADVHFKQASADAAHSQRALTTYESVLEATAADPSVRIEAAYKFGNMFRVSREGGRAINVWWTKIIDPYLVNRSSSPSQLTDQGRYWMGRAVLDLGDLYREQGQLEQAAAAWRLILGAGLSSEAERAARERLGIRQTDPK